MTEPPAEAAASHDPTSMLTSKAFVVLLLLAAVVGVVVSLAAWGFLEPVHQIQVGVFDDLPGQLGYDEGAPWWWSVPVLGLAGLVVAFAIVRLPGGGGHGPAEGLKTEVTQPIELPGVMLAAVAGIGLRIVLGPEAPVIALGGGLGILAVRLIPRDLPPQVSAVIAASRTFAALTLIFESPLVSAVTSSKPRGWAAPACRWCWSRACPRPARVAHLDRHGIVDGAELERLRARRGSLGAETAIRSSSAAASPPPARTVFFSFATLTPVGYRNLTARTDLRRTPALIEALLGQLYLVMGVSGGVANLVPRRRLDGGNSQ